MKDIMEYTSNNRYDMNFIIKEFVITEINVTVNNDNPMTRNSNPAGKLVIKMMACRSHHVVDM